MNALLLMQLYVTQMYKIENNIILLQHIITKRAGLLPTSQSFTPASTVHSVQGMI